MSAKRIKMNICRENWFISYNTSGEFRYNFAAFFRSEMKRSSAGSFPSSQHCDVQFPIYAEN